MDLGPQKELQKKEKHKQKTPIIFPISTCFTKGYGMTVLSVDQFVTIRDLYVKPLIVRGYTT